ncbi:MAG: beta-ketoacyl-ACP synthase II [Victivallales bacterium]|nr:beta-ketoacyl-ACP synthase II [Victivallales bacterium]
MTDRRVVITGAGVISCVGNNVADFWSALLEGRCGLSRVTRFDPSEYRTQIGGEVRGFEVEKYMSRKEAKRLDLFTQYAVAASDEAISSAGLPRNVEDAVDPARMGVVVSSGIGGLGTLTSEIETLINKGPSRISPLLIPMMIIDINSGALAMRYNAQGPNMGIVSACATACHSIGEAFWMIKRDDADLMLTGGSESSITQIGMAGFCSMKAMSTRNDDPLHASRPFDAGRDGFIMSEGAGVLVLEELEHAKKRGAVILAEIVGYGCTGDAYHITSPHPEGRGMARAIVNGMNHAGITATDIDYINAHGTSTELNDKFETMAIKQALGDHAYKTWVSSTKGVTGHGLGAAGGFETIACALALKNGVVPPTINYETPDPACDLDYVPNAVREKKIKYAINSNLGFGGHNGALILKRFGD